MTPINAAAIPVPHLGGLLLRMLDIRSKVTNGDKRTNEVLVVNIIA